MLDILLSFKSSALCGVSAYPCVLNSWLPQDSVNTSDPLQVKTNHNRLTANRQATNNMEAVAYRTQDASKNYLHLAVTATELKAGDNLPINFHAKSNNLAVLNQISYFTYIVSAIDQSKLEIQVSRQLMLKISWTVVNCWKSHDCG